MWHDVVFVVPWLDRHMRRIARGWMSTPDGSTLPLTQSSRPLDMLERNRLPKLFDETICTFARI